MSSQWWDLAHVSRWVRYSECLRSIQGHSYDSHLTGHDLRSEWWLSGNRLWQQMHHTPSQQELEVNLPVVLSHYQKQTPPASGHGWFEGIHQWYIFLPLMLKLYQKQTFNLTKSLCLTPFRKSSWIKVNIFCYCIKQFFVLKFKLLYLNRKIVVNQ